MRYPIGKTGTREEVEKEWYVADGFGTNRGTYYHSGIDWNLKTGGDTDFNQPIYAVANGSIIYYHYNSHSTSGFGRHLVLKVQSPWGEKWLHFAHCSDKDFISNIKNVREGEMVARIGKSGTLSSHLHCSVFKVDPINLPNGIDTIAKTKTQLNDWWENPIEFLHKWNENKDTNMDLKQLITDIRLGLLGDGPSIDELNYDIQHWVNPKDFIERITGDGKFYKKYIQPQLNSQKLALENDCNMAKVEINKDWQSKLDTANVEYKKLELRKVENFSAFALLRLAISKLRR